MSREETNREPYPIISTWEQFNKYILLVLCLLLLGKLQRVLIAWKKLARWVLVSIIRVQLERYLWGTSSKMSSVVVDFQRAI